MAKNLLEVSYNEGNIKIKGFISKPNLTRANKNEQSLYVNGRYIRSKTISDAIYEGYKTLLFTNRHPVFVLHIDIDPQNVDVNIHPSKLDVRFKHEGDVYDHVAVARKEALHAQPLIQTVSPDTETKRKPTNQYEVVRDKQSSLFVEGGEEKKGREEEFNATISSISSTVREEKTENPLVPQQKEDLASVEEYTEDKFLDFVILGQINKTFIVAENREGLIVIDQHAAEERINYEKFMDALKDNAIKKQTLIGEKVIELNPVQFQTVMNNKDILRKLGFDFEEFGGTTIKLQTIPEIFGKLQPNLFVDIINELAKVSTSIVEKEIEEKITKFACSASIKAVEELTREQMSTLIIKLGEAQNPYTCPHGRPTIIQITNADLEKKFKRTGW